MLTYLARRLVLAAITVWAITVVTFVIIQLPPGDFVDAYVAQAAAIGHGDLRGGGGGACASPTASISRSTSNTSSGLRMVASGDFGVSFEFGRPVTEVIGDRLWLTILLSLGAIVVTWGLALPIGIYSAVRQYSLGDYVFTFLGFIGLAVPNFLLALIIMYLGVPLVRRQRRRAVLGRLRAGALDLGEGLGPDEHLPLPVLILALAGTAQLVRIMRANLLDELRRPYVVTARAKGLPERRVILKYPVRAALNPFASTIGYLLPFMVSGSSSSRSCSACRRSGRCCCARWSRRTCCSPRPSSCCSAC